MWNGPGALFIAIRTNRQIDNSPESPLNPNWYSYWSYNSTTNEMVDGRKTMKIEHYGVGNIFLIQ